eukprot:933101-Pelagomonas_calceolata.AAC.1
MRVIIHMVSLCCAAVMVPFLLKCPHGVPMVPPCRAAVVVPIFSQVVSVWPVCERKCIFSWDCARVLGAVLSC